MGDNKEQEIVRLPSSLALIVWKELREKHGIEQRRDKQGFPDWCCTREELGLITKLNIQNPNRGDLKGISQLYNLQSLTISSDGSSEYRKANNICTITDKDMSEIHKLTNLKDLRINNQADIGYIYLKNFKNLQSLSITNNPNLEEIEGIEALDKLWIMDCYGNRSLTQMQGLSECIKQCEKLSDLNLDVLLFPDSIKYDARTGEYDRQASDRIKELANMSTVKWHEALPCLRTAGFAQASIQINHYQMLQMHNKSCQILADNVRDNTSIRDTVLGIEMYLAQNVEYDQDALKGKVRMASHNGVSVGPIRWS